MARNSFSVHDQTVKHVLSHDVKCVRWQTTALAGLKLTAGHKSECRRWHYKVSTYKGHYYDAASAAVAAVTLDSSLPLLRCNRLSMRKCQVCSEAPLNYWWLWNVIGYNAMKFRNFHFQIIVLISVLFVARIEFWLLIKFNDRLTKCAIKQIS